MTDALAEGGVLFLLGWLLAKTEIHIEGPDGWAVKLPTWRYGPPWLLRLTNGKPLTGYHLFMNGFLVAAFHLPLLFVEPSRAVEARILSMYFLFVMTWDFQWFVWNPAWGLGRLLAEPPWWFRATLAGLPVDYYGEVLASLAVAWLLAPASLPRRCEVALSVIGLTAAAAGSAELLARRRRRRTRRH